MYHNKQLKINIIMEAIMTHDNGLSYINSLPNRVEVIEAKLKRLNLLMENRFIETEQKKDIQRSISFWAQKLEN